MPSLNDINAAARDPLLIERMEAAATEAGFPPAEVGSWVRENARRIVGHGGIAEAYAHAVATYPPPPGQNPAAVTDQAIRDAVVHLRDTPQVVRRPQPAVEAQPEARGPDPR